MENSAYMDSITSARSMLLSDEEALAGNTTLSLETTGEFGVDGIYVYSQEHFADWLKAIRVLSREQQELLLSYYLLGKTQKTLATVHKSTQTVISFRVRMAVKMVGTYLMMGGAPTVDQMRTILIKAGLEDSLKGVGLSEIIAKYAHCRSFDRIARVYGLHRPAIRRAMSQVCKCLLGNAAVMLQDDGDGDDSSAAPRNPEEIALGAYIFNLIDKANPNGPGKSKRQKDKTARAVVLRDPLCTGEFKVAVNDPGFGSLFVSSAER
jgi:hypothetical protein